MRPKVNHRLIELSRTEPQISEIVTTGAIRPGHWLYMPHVRGQTLFIADENRKTAKTLWPDAHIQDMAEFAAFPDQLVVTPGVH